MIRSRRVQYETAGLDLADLHPDPVAQWQAWHDAAEQAGSAEPNAMTLATVDADGTPDARILLVRGASAAGFEFYTNNLSAKGRQLAGIPVAAGVFSWLDQHRQVRLRGRVVPLGPAESDAYFAERPRESQIGAWASPQSQPIADRAVLEDLVAAATARFAEGPVPRPPHWGGWRLIPRVFEFWQGRPSRLHDRFRYDRHTEGGWRITRLAP